MRLRSIVSAAVLVNVLGACGPALAAGSNNAGGGDTVYPRQLLDKRPAVAQQYKKLVAPLAAQHGWVSQGGTETPVTHVSFGGHDYLVLSSCKPHDCAAQTLVTLVQPGQDSAVGALAVNSGDQGTGPKQSQITWLGQPGRDQRRFMAAYLFR